MANELAVYERIDNPLAFAESQSDAISAAIGCDMRAGRAWAIALMRRGYDVLDFIADFHFIEGRPVKRSEAMLRDLTTKAGGKFRCLESTPEIARLEVTDADGNITVWSLSWADAQQEDWPWKSGKKPGDAPTYENLKNNWRTPRGREMMLWWRVSSAALKRVAPQVIGGLGLEDAESPEAGANGHANGVAAPARVTAAELLAQQTLAPAIDAEFTVVDSPLPADAVVHLAQPVTQTAAPIVAGDGTITDGQRTDIESLLDAIGMDADKRAAMLAKRQVSAIRSLSAEQAVDILGKLRDLQRAQQSAKN